MLSHSLCYRACVTHRMQTDCTRFHPHATRTRSRGVQQLQWDVLVRGASALWLCSRTPVLTWFVRMLACSSRVARSVQLSTITMTSAG